MYNVIDEQTARVFHAMNGKSGFFAKHSEKGSIRIFVDDLSANWLRIKAASDHTTPEEIIGKLVRKETAAAV
jgi:hypothetical protein